jgi:hypothetical protein
MGHWVTMDAPSISADPYWSIPCQCWSQISAIPGIQEDTDHARALVHRFVHQHICDVHLNAFALEEVNPPGCDSHMNKPLPSLQ